MPRKQFSSEQIITKLREAEVLLSQGMRVNKATRQLEISEQTYYRWRKEYGVKVSKSDRDRYFRRECGTVLLELEGYTQLVEVNIPKKSFWEGTCRELINKDNGLWLLEKEIAPMQKGRSLKLEMDYLGENQFMVNEKSGIGE